MKTIKSEFAEVAKDLLGAAVGGGEEQLKASCGEILTGSYGEHFQNCQTDLGNGRFHRWTNFGPAYFRKGSVFFKTNK